MAVMPFLETSNLTSQSVSLSFNMNKQYDYESYLVIGIMTNPNDSSTFQHIATIQVPYTWTSKQLMIPIPENEDGMYQKLYRLQFREEHR